MNIEKFAVIGHPIGHTMSPFIHRRLFELSGFAPDYSVLDIENVREAEKTLRTLDGFNITIPHKSNIIEILDDCDEKARIFGSVNTVKNEGGRLTGFTTDGMGCLRALQNHGADFKGEKILLLGNGGAARAIAFEAVMTETRSDITILVRDGSAEKGQRLAKELSAVSPASAIRVKTYAQECSSAEKYSLMINTTSVGMHPKIGFSPVGEEIISRCASVFDAVYNPQKTLLLQIAARLGKNVIPGMEMLVFQAVIAHEYWYGADFSNKKRELAELCASADEEMKKIFG